MAILGGVMYRKLHFFACFIVLALLAGVAGVPQVHAVSYVVFASSPDNAGVNGDCSLREAIQAAQTNAPYDTCPAGSNVDTDTIILESGKTYTLTMLGSNDESNAFGDLDFNTNGGALLDIEITTDGDEPATIAQLTPNQRIFDISVNISLRLHNLIITGGRGEVGGAIRNLNGFLELDRVTLVNNSVWVSGQLGGGLWTLWDTTITNSVFRNNVTSSGIGGAIMAGRGLTVTNTLFENNTALSGGAIYVQNFGSPAFIADISNNTFVGNTNTSLSGGTSDIWAVGSPMTMILNNNTFVGGLAPAGSVIRVEAGANAAIFNNIIGAASADTLPCSVNSPGTFTDGYNRVHATGGPCNGIGTTTLSADSLTGLGDHGGATPTILLRPGSNALDGGLIAACESTDARGVARRTGVGLCDIGAVEMFRISMASPPSTPEDPTLVNYTLNLTPPVPAGMEITLVASATSGTATAGVDFTATQQLLVFDNETAHLFVVQHFDDSFDEPNENYFVNVALDNGLAILSPPFVGSITDDDTAGVNVGASSLVLVEGGAPDSFDLSLMSEPTAAVDVTLTFDNEDFDYLPAPREAHTFTINPIDFQTPLVFDFGATADQLSENDETEYITITTDSADPAYDNLLLTPISVLITDSDPNLLVNGGFEQDSAGGASTSDKNALGWTVSPSASGKLRRECLPSGDGSPCAWLFKGNTVAQSIKQNLNLPVYTVGDTLVMSGKMRRSNIVAGVVAKLQIVFSDGQKDTVKFKFAAGTDAVFSPFTRQLVLNAPLTDVSSVTLTLSSSAVSGKIYFDDIAVYVLPRFPRGENVLPPPAAPAGLRGMN